MGKSLLKAYRLNVISIQLLGTFISRKSLCQLKRYSLLTFRNIFSLHVFNMD